MIISPVEEQVNHQNIYSNTDEAPTVASELPSNSKSYTLLLPYIRQMLPENVQTRMFFTVTKLGTKFNNIKDTFTKSQQRDYDLSIMLDVPNQVV